MILLKNLQYVVGQVSIPAEFQQSLLFLSLLSLRSPAIQRSQFEKYLPQQQKLQATPLDVAG